MNAKVAEFATCPPRMFLELAEIAEVNGNDRMRRVWIANYLRAVERV